MQALTTTIQTRDSQGRVIGEKEVATYAGLLAKAHEEGLKSIETTLLQYPNENNRNTAICLARVITDKGTFTGIGDANPENVNRRIAPHLLRMAETRAKARALRDAVNIGVVALEELGNENEEEPAPPQRPALHAVPSSPRKPEAPPEPPKEERRPFVRASDAQLRYCYRLLAEQGFEGDAATDALLKAAEIRKVADLSKEDASALIEQWSRPDPRGGRHA